MCCGIHLEDDGNTVFRNVGKNSYINAASHSQKSDGIIDYISLETSHLNEVFGVTMSLLGFGVFGEFFFSAGKITFHSFLNKPILNIFLLKFSQDLYGRTLQNVRRCDANKIKVRQNKQEHN